MLQGEGSGKRHQPVNRLELVWLETETPTGERKAALRDFLIEHLEGGGKLTNDLSKTMQLKESQLLTQIVHGK